MEWNQSRHKLRAEAARDLMSEAKILNQASSILEVVGSVMLATGEFIDNETGENVVPILFSITPKELNILADRMVDKAVYIISENVSECN